MTLEETMTGTHFGSTHRVLNANNLNANNLTANKEAS